MKVLLKNVLIEEPTTEEKKSSSGLILTQESTNPNTPTTNKVIAIGPEVTDLKPGDTVYYTPRAGWQIKEDDKTYRVLDITEILAVK